MVPQRGGGQPVNMLFWEMVEKTVTSFKFHFRGASSGGGKGPVKVCSEHVILSGLGACGGRG